MTRKKVKLTFITNENGRKATLKKRKKGLIKKISELSTLCGINACAIIYSPQDSQPEVWPSPLGVQETISEFRKMSELDQSKKMMNQESFLKQRIVKCKEQVKKMRKGSREKQMTQIMFQCLSAGMLVHNMTMIDLNDLSWLIDQNLKEICTRMEELTKSRSESQGQVAVAPATADGGRRIGEYGDQAQGVDVKMDGMQRFMDLLNSGGNGVMPPFVDANHQNPFWHNPYFP